MATVLQQQLAAIASKSTNQLDLRAQRNQHSKSLLFEPKDAANQTFDTIYQICIEGFHDLCMLDSRFMPFAQNLFSEQSKREDRTQMTAKENEELDNVIRSFLGLISGRLLLKPGHKAIEWLVRRFRVHEYNADYLILSFLPYHGNPIFATMLSILPKQLSPAFKFLHPYITSLSSPPRHAVLYNAINNPSFFSLLNQFTLSTAKKGNQSANLLGFWASLIAQAINGQLDVAQSGRSDVKRQREEDLLLRVIPVLQEALSIRNAPELYLGSCMVITILVTKTQLEDKVLDSLMDAVMQSWSTSTINDGLTCLAVIAEERQAQRLPRTTAKALLKVPQISGRLSELSTKYHVGRLFSAVVLHALDDMSRQLASIHTSLVQDFLETESVTGERKRTVIRAMFRLAQDKENLRPEISKILAAVSELEALQPVFESALSQEKIRVEDAEAMLQISLRTQQAAVEEPLVVRDVEMTDGEQPDYAAEAASAIQTLPQSQVPGETFFAPENESAVTSFGQIFALLTRAKMDTDVLLSHPSLSSEDGLATLSLMARLWCSKRPVFVRLAALQTSKQFIANKLQAPLDLQALVPYVLCALADSSEHIRRAASELLLSIVSLYRSANSKGKTGADAKIWSHDTIYGSNSKQVKFMTNQDAYKFFNTGIVPHLEECILDPTQITNVVTSTIDGADEDLELKTSIRTATFSLLASSAVATNALLARYQLLSLISKCSKTGSQGRSQVLIPAIRAWLGQSREARSAACSDAGVALSDVDQVYINSLTLRSADELECIKSIANADVTSDADAVRLSINRIRRVWPYLGSESYKVLAPFLLDNTLETGDDVLSEVRQTESLDVLRQVDLPAEVLALFLESVPDMAAMTDKPPAAKRRRTSRNEGTPGQLLSTVDLPKIIRRLTVVLELVEGSKPEKHPELLRGMFHVLSELQHYRTQLGSDLVYLQQMTIGSLLSIVDSLKTTPGAKVDRSVLRADLIVECVRSTQSTQVHNAALLLISSLSSWVPDLVLHSVMPIFTFMSTTVLRQSDDYSAHITDQTVSRVVPPLVASLRKKNQDLITGAAELLLSFTAAFEHVPIDRRLRIFSHLVTALGPDDALAAVLAMLFEKYPTDRRVAPFCSELASQFSPVTQLKAATQYLDLVADALQPKRTASEAIFSIGDKSPEQIEQSVAHLLASLAKLLQDRHLHEQISKTLSQDQSDTAAIEEMAAALLERSLGFSKSVEGKAEIHRSSGAVVTATLSLLPTPHFVRSALPLLGRPDDNLGLRVLQSFESRGDSAKPSDKDSRNALLDALPRICQVVEISTDVTLKHSAIICVDRISEKYGKKKPEAVLSAVKIIASDAALGHEHNAIRVISLLCLASAVEVLKDDMVGVIPSVMDKAIEYLSEAVEEEPNPRLHDAVFAFMTALLEHLPWIMPAKVFARLLQLACSAAAEPELDKRNKSVRDQFASLAASKVDVKVLVTSIEETFEDAVEDGYYGCSELLSILEKVIASQPKSALLKSSSAVFAPLQKAFDVRRMLALAEENTTQQELALLDSKRDAIMLETIMKLNDTTFRPFFVRLVEWATEILPASDSEGRTQRSISLYAFLAVFFERLKSIVTSYAGYILSHSASVLESTPATGDVNQALLRTVLQTLTSSFKHDQDDFWQAPSHFSTISTALLSLLLRAKQPAVRDALDLIPTIVELATVAASQDHHKELNSALLKNMRSDEALVRLAAVKTEQSLTERLGEDWLGLLPEMLPFISELQEDDDEDVERETLVWIRQIEGILGESLEGMLQ